MSRGYWRICPNKIFRIPHISEAIKTNPKEKTKKILNHKASLALK